MNFNEKLMDLRKSKGLSQDELGAELSVSRQTISKWELGQSYPDFQRLVILSDYFGLTLDALVKDIDVQPIRNKNLSDQQLSSIYHDIENVKVVLNNTKGTLTSLFNGLAIFGAVSTGLFVLIIILMVSGITIPQ